MRRTRQILTTTMAALLLTLLMTSRDRFVIADTASTTSLTISQLKVTSSNGQFITLYNSSNAVLDMSKYQIQYFNSYDLTKATSSKLIPLSGTVPPHGYFMINDSSLLLCYQLTVDSVSLGLSTTAGMVELLGFNQSSPGAAVAPTLQDFVAWSKTAANGAQTLPSGSNAFLQRLPTDSSNNPLVKSPGGGSWQTVQPDDSNACNLTTAAGSALQVPSGFGQLLPASEPPASIVSLATAAGGSTANPVIPASDVGLMAPQVTELLPNPMGIGNDSTDEYIELYNPNNSSFDLDSFIIQSGLTTTHKYILPTGTSLAAHSFKAFSSDTTGLSLSNTSGLVKLLDPIGNTISASDPYSGAKDGQTWALAKGKWYWTTEATPNKSNVIKQAVSAKKRSSSKSKSSTKQGASTTALANSVPGEPDIIPIHTRTLAIVVGAAILYGAYEYRTDARNKFHQLRRHFNAGKTDRQPPKRRRSD